MSKTAPLILGIAALGGIGYLVMTGGMTGGSLTGGGTTYPSPPSGGIEIPGDGGSTTIERRWKKRADVSYSTNRTTCAVNGFKAKVYTESDTYAPGDTVRIAVLGKYFENKGDSDWWAYAGGANVNLNSWYGGKERVYTGIEVVSDEDPSSVITVQDYGAYPQSPEATGGSAVVPSGDLTQGVLDDVSSRSPSGGNAGRDKWGLAVYTFTAPSTPGRYTVDFRMGIDDTARSLCNPKSKSADFSILVRDGTVLESETLPAPVTLSGGRFTPIGSVQSHRVW